MECVSFQKHKAKDTKENTWKMLLETRSSKKGETLGGV